jgi:hypothetical protein
MVTMLTRRVWKVDINQIVIEQVGKALGAPEFQVDEKGLTPANIETKAFTRARVNIAMAWMHAVYATKDIWTSSEREIVAEIARKALDKDEDRMIDFLSLFCN